MYTYENTSDHELTLVGHGTVEAGGTFTSDLRLENPNLTLTDGPANDDVQEGEIVQSAAAPALPTPAPEAAPLIEVHPAAPLIAAPALNPGDPS